MIELRFSHKTNNQILWDSCTTTRLLLYYFRQPQCIGLDACTVLYRSYFLKYLLIFTMGVQKSLQIISVIIIYCTISISMVFLNKILGKFSPMFVTWYQCVVTVFISYILGELSLKYPNSWFKQFPRFEYRPEIAKHMMQLSLV